MIICLDGIDGAGKTAQTVLLQVYLLSKGHNVVILKPFHFVGLGLKKFSDKMRKLTSLFKQAQIRNYRTGLSAHVKTPLVTVYVTNLALLLLVIINLKFEIIISRIIYGANVIIIYDRFYFDKLIPVNKIWYRIFYAILKHVINESCVILDVPTSIAYKRMKDVYDKLMSKKHYDTLRKWYKIYAKLLGFPIINTSHLSLLETHALIISIFENMIRKKGNDT
ncbi:MAG: hypothetical protein QXR39_02005 [Candidatus Methanomethylicia archaeon]